MGGVEAEKSTTDIPATACKNEQALAFARDALQLQRDTVLIECLWVWDAAASDEVHSATASTACSSGR